MSTTPTSDFVFPFVLRDADPQQNNGRREVAFIDKGVADYQTLVDGVRAGVEVVLLDSGQDGLAQMAAWAQSRSGFDAIHVLSHGSEGTLRLGRNTVTQSSLSDAGVQAELVALGQALTADGDLLLYGCSVAAGEAGQVFVANLAAATGADVAASEDATGTAAKGGDWILEEKTGKTVPELHISDFAQTLTSTTLAAGDIAVVGMNADTGTYSQYWAFVPFVDIGSGTVIHFTDDGISDSGSFLAVSPEAHLTWTVPSDIAAGTLIVANGTKDSVDIFSYTGESGNLGSFSTAGDQIIVYQGTAGTTTGATFIYAFNNAQALSYTNGIGTWGGTNGIGAQNSQLPSGLTNGTSAIALTSAWQKTPFFQNSACSKFQHTGFS